MELQAFRNWNGSSSISDDREGGCVDLVLARGREGVQNPENSADVICERPLTSSNVQTIPPFAPYLARKNQIYLLEIAGFLMA